MTVTAQRSPLVVHVVNEVLRATARDCLVLVDLEVDRALCVVTFREFRDGRAYDGPPPDPDRPRTDYGVDCDIASAGGALEWHASAAGGTGSEGVYRVSYRSPRSWVSNSVDDSLLLALRLSGEEEIRWERRFPIVLA